MFTLWMIVGNTLFWLCCCFWLAYAVRVLPTRVYKMRLFTTTTSIEQQLWTYLRVHRWKDMLPEWGHIFRFQKRSLHQLSPAYVERFIQETQYAELGHLLMAICGFFCIPLNPPSQYVMALCCALVNVCIQLPFCVIQRYNRPRLIRLHERLLHAKTSKQKKHLEC